MKMMIFWNGTTNTESSFNDICKPIKHHSRIAYNNEKNYFEINNRTQSMVEIPVHPTQVYSQISFDWEILSREWIWSSFFIQYWKQRIHGNGQSEAWKLDLFPFLTLSVSSLNITLNQLGAIVIKYGECLIRNRVFEPANYGHQIGQLLTIKCYYLFSFKSLSKEKQGWTGSVGKVTFIWI